MAASASSITKVQQLYVAYYGRAGDPAGVEFWASTLDANGGNVSEMINQFGNSDEYTNGIGQGSISQQVSDLYQQMFNRAPETAGLDFWVSEISSGKRTLGEVAVAIAESALSDDATTLTNKVTAAEFFTEQVTTLGVEYDAEDISEAQAIIASVTSNSTSITTANSGSVEFLTPKFSITSLLSEPEFVELPLFKNSNEGVAFVIDNAPELYEYNQPTDNVISIVGGNEQYIDDLGSNTEF